MTINPTGEQAQALEMFATGRSLVIEAGAGTGKTSTLRLLAESAPNRRGQYLAFNRAIVQESKAKFPRTVRCNTAHSAAMRVMASRLNMERLTSPRMKSWDIAAQLGINSGFNVTTQEGDHKQLSATYLAGLTMKAITRFCQSADPEPAAIHVPYIKGIDYPPGSFTNNREVARTLVPYMRKAWADLMRADGNLKFEHDHYLKAWQLDNPIIDTDYILFDEAQDANPVMVAIVAAQADRAQLVWVGDSQQQIYTFTGAVNAMQTVGAEQTAYLTQSFRFGPAIATVANTILGQIEGAVLRLTGTPSIESTVGPVPEPRAILCRTNANAVREVLDAQRDGRKAHLVGGGSEIVKFARAAQNLMDGRRTEHADLACFDTWNEVQEYVEQDEQGGDLRLMVTLISEFTVPVILAALDNMVAEGQADLIVSTAHKSKGREWDTVRLGSDFPDVPEGEELRLLYVAATRAKLRLDHGAVPWLTRTGRLAHEVGASDRRIETDEELAAGLVKAGLAADLDAANELIDATHDDPAHDFAACPRCIRRAREAEHEAEVQHAETALSDANERGNAEAIQRAETRLSNATERAEERAPSPGSRCGRSSLTNVRLQPGDTLDVTWTMHTGRSEAINISPAIAASYARDVHERTGKHVTVLDAAGEIVTEFPA